MEDFCILKSGYILTGCCFSLSAQSSSSRKRAGLQREQEKLQSHNSHESRLPSGHRIVSLLFNLASRLLKRTKGSQYSLWLFSPGMCRVVIKWKLLICANGRNTFLLELILSFTFTETLILFLSVF